MNVDSTNADDANLAETDAWRPHTSPVIASDFSSLVNDGTDVAIHFWANWNAIDRYFDESLDSIKARLNGWINLYSCDVDDPRNREWLESLDVATVPTLIIFRDGGLTHRVIGCREPKPLLREIMVGLTSGKQTPRSWLRFW